MLGTVSRNWLYNNTIIKSKYKIKQEEDKTIAESERFQEKISVLHKKLKEKLEKTLQR